MGEHYEDVLRRRAEHGTVALAKVDADHLADLVAAVRAYRREAGASRMSAVFHALAVLDEAADCG